MIGWTKFHESAFDVNANYDRVNISQDLKDACQALLNHIVTTKMEFPTRPFMPPTYAEFIDKHREEFKCDIPRGRISGWFNDPKYLRAIRLPIREILMDHLPIDLVMNALAALEKQETVYEHALIFRVIKLECGDSVMLHYDPRTFYTTDRMWQKDHLDNYTDKRAFVFMNDKKPGQVTWLGDSEINYRMFDMIKFDCDKVYHGSANFGYDDRYMICFSWAEPI